ncbi:unnamed protein product, partial [Didymodactylos carnosus]
MKLKEIDRTVHVAWSPANQQPIYLVAGTAAQQLDASFSTNSTLELFQLNMADRSTAMTPLSSIKTDHRFKKLVWTHFPSSENLLICATEKGSIYLVDPFSHDDSAIKSKLDQHSGSVNTIDVNPIEKNLFASGSSDSELMIWDLNDLSKPMIPGGSNRDKQQRDDVECVGWNKQKPQILGSTLGGKCLIWDLRSAEPIFKISDSTYRMRSKYLVWHPEITSQLCLASEEDSSAIQLWDLRYGASPMKLLSGHSRGVLDLQWCPNDGNLLMSSGKDNKILCWNPNDLGVMSEIVYEIPCSHWCFDVKWCLADPNLISAASFDGTLSIYTIMGGSCQISRPANNQLFTQAFGNGTQGNFLDHELFGGGPLTGQQPQPQTLLPTVQNVAPIKYAPKWMRRQARVTFAFGGKLIVVQSTVANASSSSANVVDGTIPSTTQPPPRRLVVISQVTVDKQFIQSVQTFDKVLQTGTLIEYCDHKISTSRASDELILWRFIRGSFEREQKRTYIELLGFKQDELVNRVNNLMTKTVKVNDDLHDTMHNLQLNNNISGKTTPTIDIQQAHGRSTPAMGANIEVEAVLSRCIMTGNFESAVDLCFHEQRYTDAILLANLGGQDLLYKTQKRYFTKVHSYTTKLIDIVLHQDYKRLIQTNNISNWREILVALLTYTSDDTFVQLCEELALKLGQEPTLKSYACICYIIMGNLEKFDQCYSLSHHFDENDSKQLEILIEKIFILKRSLEYSQPVQALDGLSGPSISKHLVKYAQLLANEGYTQAALKYLGNLQTPELLVLRDRLYHGLPLDKQVGIPKPPCPYRKIDVLSTAQQQKVQTTKRESVDIPRTTRPFDQYSVSKQHMSNVSPSVGYTNYQPPLVTPLSQTMNYVPSNSNPAPTPGNFNFFKPPDQPAQPVYSVTQAPPTNANWPPQQPTNEANMRQTSNIKYPTPPSIPTYQPYQPPATIPTLTPMGTNNSVSNHPIEPPPVVYHPPSVPWNDPPNVMMKQKAVQPKAQHPMAPEAIMQPLPGSINPYQPQEYPFNFSNQQQQQPPHHLTNYSQHGTIPPNSYPQSVQPDPVNSTPAQPPPPPAPIVKAQLPSEHQIIQDIFDILVQQCLQATQQLPLKRKLDDVNKKLQILYDKLRENR